MLYFVLALGLGRSNKVKIQKINLPEPPHPPKKREAENYGGVLFSIASSNAFWKRKICQNPFHPFLYSCNNSKNRSPQTPESRTKGKIPHVESGGFHLQRPARKKDRKWRGKKGGFQPQNPGSKKGRTPQGKKGGFQPDVSTRASTWTLDFFHWQNALELLRETRAANPFCPRGSVPFFLTLQVLGGRFSELPQGQGKTGLYLAHTTTKKTKQQTTEKGVFTQIFPQSPSQNRVVFSPHPNKEDKTANHWKGGFQPDFSPDPPPQWISIFPNPLREVGPKKANLLEKCAQFYS